MKQGPLFEGCQFLFSTNHPDIAVVELRSLLGMLAGNGLKRFVVDRSDRESITQAMVDLTLNVMTRDLQNGRAARAKDELQWWCGLRVQDMGQPRSGEAYRPA